MKNPYIIFSSFQKLEDQKNQNYSFRINVDYYIYETLTS